MSAHLLGGRRVPKLRKRNLCPHVTQLNSDPTLFSVGSLQQLLLLLIAHPVFYCLPLPSLPAINFTKYCIVANECNIIPYRSTINFPVRFEEPCRGPSSSHKIDNTSWKKNMCRNFSCAKGTPWLQEMAATNHIPFLHWPFSPHFSFHRWCEIILLPLGDMNRV